MFAKMYRWSWNTNKACNLNLSGAHCLLNKNQSYLGASQVAPVVKNLPAMQECRFSPWVGKIPWRRKWQRTPAFLPGESHGQRSLAGYSPWDWRVGHDVVIKQQQQNNQCFIDHFNHLNVHNSGIKHLHPVVQLWWLYNSRTVHHPKS